MDRVVSRAWLVLLRVVAAALGLILVLGAASVPAAFAEETTGDSTPTPTQVGEEGVDSTSTTTPSAPDESAVPADPTLSTDPELTVEPTLPAEPDSVSQEDPSPTSQVDADDAGAPMLFAAAEDSAIYSLEWRTQGQKNRLVTIKELTVSGDTVDGAGQVVGQSDVKVQAEMSDNDDRRVDALGVTFDNAGNPVFYYTVQRGVASQAGKIDIFSYRPATAPSSASLEVSNLSLNSGGGGFIVGGAVNPVDGAYYFMYYSATPASSPLGAGNARAHLYRYYPGTSTVGEVAHVDIPKQSTFSTTADEVNGDIEFDSAGNLHLVMSNPGTVSSAGQLMLATLDFEEFKDLRTINYTDPDAVPVPTILATATQGAKDQDPIYNAVAGAAYNGFAYTADGDAALQYGVAGSSIFLADPVTFTRIGDTSTVQSGNLVTDLASAHAVPVISAQSGFPEGKIDADDSLSLEVKQGAQVVGRAVLASDGEMVRVGPFPVRVGTLVTVTQAFAAGSSTYETNWTCRDSAGTLIANGEGVVAAYTPEATGSVVLCAFVNTPVAPKLSVAQSSTDDEGRAISAGQVIQAGATLRYRIDFDNRDGGADARVNHINALADVLDDASFVVTSVRYGDGSESGYEAELAEASTLAASAPDSNGSMSIEGTVPAGDLVTVWFEVIVKANSTDAIARTQSTSLTGYQLESTVYPADATAPVSCDAAPSGCLVNPVAAWQVQLGSFPADGALIHRSGNVHYNVAVTKLNHASFALEGVQVSADLTEVLAAANWAADPRVPAGAKARGIYLYDALGNLVGTPLLADQAVPAPQLTPGSGEAPLYDSTWLAESVNFSMPENVVRAEVWFAVEGGDPPQVEGQWMPSQPNKGTTFANFVSAASATMDPVPCATNATGGELCEVSHTIESSFFTIRKDGQGVGGTVTDLTGHEFELRDHTANGVVPTDPSDVMCPDWRTAPTDPNTVDPTCAMFYPIASGEQEGRWRAQNVPEGTYWLVETKAPDGYQLLAEPIRFSVNAEGKLTIRDDFDNPVPACGPIATNPTACIQPTGYLMLLKDPKFVPLPLAGGAGVSWFNTVGAALLVLGAAGGVWYQLRESLTKRAKQHSN